MVAGSCQELAVRRAVTPVVGWLPFGVFSALLLLKVRLEVVQPGVVVRV